MPRALTEQEKGAQRQRLLEKGRAVVMTRGVRKVSVDDIAKAAGLAKGTFYQHFESKEHYLYALIENMHQSAFSQAEHIVAEALASQDSPQGSARIVLQKLFFLPEMAFFIQNETDVALLFETVSDKEKQSFKQMEEGLFEGILCLFGLDTEKVRPGVVHNYVHTLFLMKSCEYMVENDLPKTMDLVMDSLIFYAFGGSQ